MHSRLTIGTAPIRLRYRVIAGIALGFFTLAIIVSLLSGSWLSASGIWLAVAVYVSYRLGQNHAAEGDSPSERFGLANSVTLFRGWLVALFFGLLTASAVRLSTAIFVVAILLDAADGAIARRTRETVLGAYLDGATDALTLLVGATAGVLIDVLPSWYLLAGVLWYGYSAALLFRTWAGKSIYELPPSRLRPLVGSAQFLVLAAALWPGASVPRFVAAGALVALLASFLRDWAAATGRLYER